MKKCLLLALLILSLPLGSIGSAAVDEINPFARGSWKHILDSHAGQPMVVHFWGATCGPCRVEMPRWGELLQERPNLNLVVINADLVPNEADAVSAMLAQTGLAAAENWMFTDGFVERLRYEIDPQWHGEIPADLEVVKAWLDHEGSISRPSSRLNSIL